MKTGHLYRNPVRGSQSYWLGFWVNDEPLGSWTGVVKLPINGHAAEGHCANANKGAADIVGTRRACRGRNLVYCLSAGPCPNWIPLGR